MPIQVVRDAVNAKRHMIGKLSEGTTLARLITKRIDFSQGIFRLPMPETVDQSETLDLDSGNIRLAKDEEAIFARIIKAFIGSSDCALLMQELEASMSDLNSGKILQYRRLAVPYHEEVYWRVSGADLAVLSEDEILDIINSASYLPWIGFFYLDGISRSTTVMNDADLEHVASNLLGVAVSAFDYRSFLIWWRDDVHPFPL